VATTWRVPLLRTRRTPACRSAGTPCSSRRHARYRQRDLLDAVEQASSPPRTRRWWWQPSGFDFPSSGRRGPTGAERFHPACVVMGARVVRTAGRTMCRTRLGEASLRLHWSHVSSVARGWRCRGPGKRSSLPREELPRFVGWVDDTGRSAKRRMARELEQASNDSAYRHVECRSHGFRLRSRSARCVRNLCRRDTWQNPSPVELNRSRQLAHDRESGVVRNERR